MMRFTAIVALFPDLPPPTLHDWVARGWVRADGTTPDEWQFAEIDVARIRLIRDLRLAMAVEEETMPLVLSLLDQVHALRHRLRAIASAMEDQPPELRDAVLAALAAR
jgi:chaperone modulatory protein CbpM